MQAMLATDLGLTRNLNRKSASQAGFSTEPQRLKLIHRNDKMPCNQIHVRHFDESTLPDLEPHQMHGKGLHKCCQCAYNSGYQQGSLLQTFISLDIDSLGEAHTSANGGYKSVHQAFSQGYNDGVNSFIRS